MIYSYHLISTISLAYVPSVYKFLWCEKHINTSNNVLVLHLCQEFLIHSTLHFLELERIKNPWHHLPSRELLIRSAQHVWEAVHLSKPRVSDLLRFTFWEQSGPETFDLNEHHMNWFHVYFTGISCLNFIWVTLRRNKCIFLFKFSLHVPSDQWFNNLIFWIVYYMYVSFRIIAVLIFTCTCV